jgi:TolB protein
MVAMIAACSHGSTSADDLGVSVDLSVNGDGAIFPCAQLVFVTSVAGHSHLALAAADGSAMRVATSGDSDDLYPAFSPDGASVVYASSSGGLYQLMKLDVASGNTQPLETDTASATAPAFSPDGMTIAFEGRAAENAASDIYTVAAAGGAAVALTASADAGGSGRDAGPAWSPDGATLYFASDRSGTFDLWSMNRDGSNLRARTSGTGLLGRPAVSPDGKSIALTQSLGQGSKVVRLDLASMQSTVLSTADDSEPAFSPDGTRLALTTLRFGAPQLITVAATDGSGVVRLTNDATSDGSAAFSPAACP